MATTQQQETMLLTEHFSWPPITLIDDIINTINEVLYRCTDTFEAGLSSAPPHLLGFADRYAAEQRQPDQDDDGNPVFPEAGLEIDEGVLKLETLMENAVDRNFDRLEIWTLRNVLCLPRGEEELARWVRLGHYKGVDGGSVGDGGAGWTPEGLYALRRKLVETRKVRVGLEAERRRNEVLIEQLRGLVGAGVVTATKREVEGSERVLNTDSAFAFLTHTSAAQDLGVAPLPASASASAPTPKAPLTTHTSFTTTQLPHLRHLLNNLRPHIPRSALPTARNSNSNSNSNNNNNNNSSNSDATDPEDPSSLAQARKFYLEGQSRRVLERRGVDAKEGVEGNVEGRVSGDEVRGLEGIVEAFGVARGAKREKGEKGRGDLEEMELC